MITPEAIISYPHLFTPDSFDGDENSDDAKYSAAFIFVEDTDISGLEKVVIDTAVDRWGPKAKAALVSGKLRNPLRTDIKPGYPEGSTFLNARSKNRPGVVSQVPDASNDGKPTVITDKDAIVAGARVFAAISAFAYDHKGNKGVSFGLDHVQLIRPPTEEERLDGRVAAADAFDADKNAVADLSDLEEDDGGLDELSDLR